MKTPLNVLFRRLAKLTRTERIAYLRAYLKMEQEGTIRWKEIYDYLKLEVAAKLRSENRAA